MYSFFGFDCVCVGLMWILCHGDADQAFVQSDLLEEDVFMRLPRGCGDVPVIVVRPNRSLYRLK